jgi:hypothetical protein
MHLAVDNSNLVEEVADAGEYKILHYVVWR